VLSISLQLPKLKVAGSNPVARLILQAFRVVSVGEMSGL